METTKLKVISLSTETKIPINGVIHYECSDCNDTGLIGVSPEPDYYSEVKCPFCWRGEESDMTGAINSGDR